MIVSTEALWLYLDCSVNAWLREAWFHNRGAFFISVLKKFGESVSKMGKVKINDLPHKSWPSKEKWCHWSRVSLKNCICVCHCFCDISCGNSDGKKCSRLPANSRSSLVQRVLMWVSSFGTELWAGQRVSRELSAVSRRNVASLLLLSPTREIVLLILNCRIECFFYFQLQQAH